jgi:Flp pilus assembly protein TadG
MAKRLRRRREDDERGAEMVEFAFVVVLLIALLYGITTFGLILAVKSTLTQAAADAARSGIVTPSTAVATAEAEACRDVGWMNKTCGSPTTFSGCTFTPNPADAINAFACTETCPNTTYTCLSVTVQYQYNSSPILVSMPPVSYFTPATISSTNVLQISTPSGA